MATKPVEIEILLKDRLSAGLDAMQRKLDAMMAASTSASERVRLLDAAIGALNVQLAALKEAGKGANPDLDQSGNIADIERVEAKIKELRAQLETLDATAKGTQTVPPGAPEAVKQYNGLHMSIQQIAREMPSLAMGSQMFFLAISNNLPIFTDELARARKEYEALTASGQKATPVWKQVLSSLFSWQTALTTGIMLLVMYGDEIVDWVAGLFRGKKALDATAEVQRGLNAAMGEARTSAAKETAQLNLLYKMTQNTSASLRDRKAAVSELQRQYPAYFGNLSQEAILAGNAAGQYRQLANDILQAAYARAYQKRIENLAEQNVGLQRSINADSNWTRRNREEYNRRLERIRLSQEAQEASAGNSTDAAAAVATAALERQTDEIITEYERRTDALAKNRAQLAANEQAMQAYEQEILKRQKPLMQTTQGQSYAENRAAPAAGAGKAGERRLEAQRKLADDLLALERQNQDDELDLMDEGTEKKLAQIDADYAKRKAEIEKQAAGLAVANRKAGETDVNAIGLTGEQQEAVDRANLLNEEKRKAAVQSVYAAEAAAMRDYLKQYGTYQQQKLAIAEDYAERIRKAQNEGERLTLTAERDHALQQVEADAISRQIDWGSVFGEFGAMFRDELQPTLDRLRQMAGSEAFRQSSLEDQQLLYRLIEKLEQSGAVWDGDIFKRVSDDINAYQDAMRRYMEAQERERAATEALTAAKERLREAEASGDGDAVSAATDSVAAAQEAFDTASVDVRAFGSEVQQATADLQASSQKAVGMFQGLEAGLQGLSSGSLQGVGQGLMQLDKLFGGGALTREAGNALAKGFQSLLGKDSEAARSLTEALGDTGMAGQIISAVLGILDMLAEGGVSGIVTSLQDTVLGAVEGILDDLLSGDIIMKPLENVLGHVSGILDTVTFGGFGKLVDKISGSNAREVQASIDRLTERNEMLQQSIEDLTDTIKGGEGRKSVAAYQQAYDYQAEQNANYLAIAQAQAGYHGSHHSWNYYWAGFSREQIDKLSQQIGRQWDGDLWSLTPEEMKMLRANVDLWKQIQDTGKGGYGDRLTEKLDDYIDQAGKLEELEEQLNESLTQISFDSLYDSFIDTLMDMDASAEDIAGNVGEYFMRALLANQIGEQYKERLQAWYEDFAERMKDNDLSEEDIAALTDSYGAIVEDAVALRDQLAAATGYDGEAGGTSQSGKAGSFNAMSQEQGTKLEGLFTSGQMHWASIDEQMQDVSEQMAGAVDHLRRIEENTGNSARHLGEIKEDIKKILRDGLRVK